MPTRERKMDSDATTLRESSRAATVSPTQSEIARVAYQLWQDSGCPIGSDHEDWFRAEAMLKSALTPKCEEPSRLRSIPRRDAIHESEVLCQVRWRGHWEVWEMEWEGPRWVWD